ncbi:MAG: helix-turn-helix domain-containing protein [Thermomicrobiales bacterium]
MAAPQQASFGALLRRFRLAAGLSQEELAERAGLSARGISDLERGARQAPRPETVELLVVALGLDDRDRDRLVASVRRARVVAIGQYEGRRQATASELGIAPVPDPIDANWHNLPAPLTPLVGRAAEIAHIAAVLATGRLVTISGPGGSGKTRLALAAAWDALRQPPTEVWWVELAGVAATDDPALARATLVGVIAGALGLVLPGRDAPLDALAAALRERSALRVLDNCEHRPECAAVVRALLEAAPALRVLATSRESLGLVGEILLRLGGLPVPDPGATDPAAWASVQLFVERANRQAPADWADPVALRGTARLVRLLDGLPLAIELAAGWVGHYSPDEIATEIAADPDFLAATARDVPDRHRSLRAAFDYSWRLLGAAEQRDFRRLAVFRGGFDRAAASGIAGVRPAGLVALVDKSLLRVVDTGRYVLHELLRQFAAERLATTDEAAPLADAHATYYLALAEQADPQLTGPEQAAWVARIERDADNLHAALGWARERGEAETLLRLVGALAHFWTTRGHTAEGRDWLEVALTLPGAGTVPAAIRARALYGAGVLASDQGDFALAEERLAASAAHFREAGELVGAVRALNTRGGVTFNRGDLILAAERYEACVALARDAGDTGEAARALGNLGETWLFLGDPRGGDALTEALALARAAGRRDVEAYVLGDLGTLARQRGDLALASARHREALALHQSIGALRQIAVTLENLAALAVAERRGERAARLLGAATALRETIAIPRPVPEQQLADATRAGAEAILPDGLPYDVAFAAGAALPLADAIAEALT